MKILIITLLRIYRKLSAFRMPCCRFYPSCSNYAEEAIIKYGVIKGGILSMRRVCRCHPWSPGGYDPVP